MSDFWAEKLAGRRPAPQTPAAHPLAPGAWWQQPTRPAAPPTAPAPFQAPHAPAAPAAPAPYAPTRTPGYAAADKGLCPECRSDNYFESDPRQGPRCYSCGYTSGQRTRNSTFGSGAAVSQKSGMSRAARQVTGSGYRPDVIVGHI